MKKLIIIICCITALCGCQKSKTVVTQIQSRQDPFIETYYSAQNDSAFKMLKKAIFKELLNGWTADTVNNPIWIYGDFTKYTILNSDLSVNEEFDNYYMCTYIADDDQFGYVILAKEADSLAKIEAVQTTYRYDYQANIEFIHEALAASEINSASAKAERVSIINDNENKEALKITDAYGHCLLIYFEAEGPILYKNSKPL